MLSNRLMWFVGVVGGLSFGACGKSEAPQGPAAPAAGAAQDTTSADAPSKEDIGKIDCAKATDTAIECAMKSGLKTDYQEAHKQELIAACEMRKSTYDPAKEMSVSAGRTFLKRSGGDCK